MSIEAWGDEGLEADPIFGEARVEEAFRDGLRAAREYMACFVEQGGDRATADSIRLNWNPAWGVDEGQMTGEQWIDPWGMTSELRARCRANTERLMNAHTQPIPPAPVALVTCDNRCGYSSDIRRVEHSMACAAKSAALSPQTLPAPGEVERAAVVAYIRRQSDRGADIGNEKPKGSTARAAFGGSSLALKRVADNIEAGEHILNDNAALATVAAANDEAVANDQAIERRVRIAAWNAAKKSGATDALGYAVVEAVVAEFAAIRLLSQEGRK